MKLVVLVCVLAACKQGDRAPVVVEKTPAPPAPPAPVVPKPIDTAPTRNTVAVGMGYGCVRTREAKLACWGRSYPPSPTIVDGIADVAGVTASQAMTCAWTAKGAVYCQDGGPLAHIEGIDDAVELATDPDAFLTCARRKSGHVACWSSLGKLKPVKDVGGIEHALEIAVAGSTACVRDKDGVACWSGGWVDAEPVAKLQRIASAAHATRIAGGHFRFAALLPGKPAVGWAEEGLAAVVLPKQLPADATQIALGGDDACVLAPGGVTCWATKTGELYAIPNLAGAQEIAVGDALGCARLHGGVACWGSLGALGDGEPISLDNRSVEVANLTDATAVAVTNETACARRKTGAIVCWGRRDDGRSDPQPVPSRSKLLAGDCSTGRCGPGVTKEWTGSYQRGGWDCTRARKTTCTMSFIGRHDEGTSTEPDESWGNLDMVRDIKMPMNMNGSVCLADEHGDVRCFQAFDTADRATQIDGVTDAIGLTGYADQTCAVERTGTVKCWGEVEPVTVRAIAGITDAIQISGGEVSACAVRRSGKVSCWGYRSLLGDNADRFQRIPKPIAGLSL